MANLKMVLYTAFDGVESRITWKNEEVYRQVKKFLEDMDVQLGPISGNVPTDAEFAYMETEQQYDAMVEFVRSLEKNETT
jgi:hypothetical protein